MATDDALRLVHAKAGTALRTQPFGIILGDKALHSDGLNASKICNDAYPIFHPVPVIEMKQLGTREFGTRKAELMTTSGKVSTVLDDTGEACV
jgi:hypothetical protein